MKRKGFTLVELLAVIVMLVIILAIAVPSITTMLSNSTRSTFESDAKMVLKVVKYKMLEDSNFNLNSINETTIKNDLDIDNSNYESLTVKKMSDELYITIVGKNKWDKLTVSGTEKISNVAKTVTTFSNGANKPVLATGMTPIKWNDSAWVETTEDDTDWYNYNTADKKWANAKTEDGSMWVWIPRYIYKISSGWHSNTTGTIDIQFSKGVDDNWNKASIGVISLKEGAEASNGTWTNHPAFTFGSTELTGIWVAKFEATATEGVENGYVSSWECLTSGDNVITKSIKVVPNVASWRCININNAFTVSRNMETNPTYGWGTTGNNIDTHLMKNTEWGAIAYLSKSTYGKNTEEIWPNPNQDYTTGCAGDSVLASKTTLCNSYETTNGVNASTTGNIYGIYDMSGGAWERVSAYVDNGNGNLLSNGSTIIAADNKYKDIYTKGSTDNQATNYGLTINKKGDALYETSNNANGHYSWFSEYSNMPYMSHPLFVRGGLFNTGVFYFSTTYGNPYTASGFRPVLVVNLGL